eukprot:tig00021017_g17201.t1
MTEAALCNADLLPPELLASIFVRLDMQERFRAAAVCKKWAQAAREPPHNTSLDLVIAGDVPEGDARGLLRRKRREFASRRPRSDSEHAGLRAAQLRLDTYEKRALSVAAAAEVVRHPICAGVSRLRISVCSVGLPRINVCSAALGSPDDLPAGGCGLPEVLAACGARLEALEVAAGGLDDAAALVLRVDGLERLAPALRSLRLWCADGSLGRIDEIERLPRLGRLEELGASVSPACGAELLERLPALRACFDVALMFEDVGPALGALAAAGVRCRALALLGDDSFDLRDAGAAAQLAAVLRPCEVDAAAVPAALCLEFCRLPGPEGVPPDALAGLEEVTVQACDLDAPALRWLAGGPHAATLRSLRFAHACRLTISWGAGGGAPGMEVRLRLDWDEAPDEVAAFLDALAASPRLLRAVQVEAHGLPPEAGVREAHARYRAARAALPDQA